MDKDYIDNGTIRIGFTEPSLDIIISCDSGELKKFTRTVEAVKDTSNQEWLLICDCMSVDYWCVCEEDDDVACPNPAVHTPPYCYFCARTFHYLLPAKSRVSKLLNI